MDSIDTQSADARHATAGVGSLRRYGVVAVVGGLLGVLVSPLLNIAYHRTPLGQGTASPWEPVLASLVTAVFGNADPTAVYRTFGRIGVFAFVALLVGLLGLRAVWSTRTATRTDWRPGRTARWGLGLAIAGVAWTLAVNVSDYYLLAGDRLTPVLGDAVFFAFVGATLVGVLAMAVGLATVAVAGRRVLPVGVVLALVAWLPVGIGLTFVGMDNVPGGYLLPLSVGTVALGAWLVRTPVQDGTLDRPTDADVAH